MALRTLTGRIVGVSVLATITAAGTYGYAIKRRISIVDQSKITSFDDIPDAFQQSHSVKTLVNPRNYQRMADSRYTTIDIPEKLHDVSDEVLLAQFVKGFFGGAVIAPERITLQTLKLDLVHYKGLPKTQPPVWSKRELSDGTLPSLNTILYGVFQVSDVQLTSQSDQKSLKEPSESYIDFCFGSDEFRFAGVHRFRIVRTPARNADEPTKVHVHLQSMSCNPIKNMQLGPPLMYSFHKMYAQLLFSDGVSEIQRWLNRSA